MYTLKLSWQEFKSICLTQKKLLAQYTGTNPYTVFAIDSSLFYECRLIDTTEISDFETSYKNTFNQRLEAPLDNVGNLMVKPRPVDGTLHLCFVYVDFGARTVDFGADGAYWTLNTTSTTQTVLRYYPSFAYYIDGGSFKTINAPTVGNINTSVTIAPDISAQLGGHKVIIENKRIILGDSLVVSVPPKYVAYIPNVPANVVQITFDHPENETGLVELCLRVYY